MLRSSSIVPPPTLRERLCALAVLLQEFLIVLGILACFLAGSAVVGDLINRYVFGFHQLFWSWSALAEGFATAMLCSPVGFVLWILYRVARLEYWETIRVQRALSRASASSSRACGDIGSADHSA